MDRTNPSIESKLKKLEELLLEPDIRRSESDLNEIIADDFVEVGSTGKVYTKSEVIAALLKEQEFKMTLTDFTMKKLSEKCYQVTYKVKKEDNGKVLQSIRSSIWIVENGEYRIIFHQGTVIK